MTLDRDAFVSAYIEAAYFTDCNGEDGQPPSDAELAPEARAQIDRECGEFLDARSELLERACAREGYTAERAGHDFWLTRNWHGAGFWDRAELEEGELGELLTGYAQATGSRDLYEGDDGRLYLA